MAASVEAVMGVLIDVVTRYASGKTFISDSFKGAVTCVGVSCTNVGKAWCKKCDSIADVTAVVIVAEPVLLAATMVDKIDSESSADGPDAKTLVART